MKPELKAKMTKYQMTEYFRHLVFDELGSASIAAKHFKTDKKTIYNIVGGTQYPTKPILKKLGYELVKTVEFVQVKK